MGVLEVGVDRIKETLRGVFEPYGFECHPFKIGWYNDCVMKQFMFDYDRDTLAFILISTPSMFEKAFKPFLVSPQCAGVKDPIDQCMDYHFKRVVQAFPDEDVELIHDYQMTNQRRPLVLVQTAGHVSGAAFYYQRSSVKHDPWEKRKRIHGVSIHPLYGGWFGLRGIFVLRNVRVPTMPFVPAVDVLSDEQKITVLNQFNDNWRDGAFRDIIAVEDRYSEVQQRYFLTRPMDRKELIQELKNEVLKGNSGGDASGGTLVNDIHQTTNYGEHRAIKHNGERNSQLRCEHSTTQHSSEHSATQHSREHMGTQHSNELSEPVTSALTRYKLDDELAVKKNVWTKKAVSTEKSS